MEIDPVPLGATQAWANPERGRLKKTKIAEKKKTNLRVEK
jgi:hypothetical protein